MAEKMRHERMLNTSCRRLSFLLLWQPYFIPPLMKRCRLLSACILAAVLALTGSRSAAASPERPNIIIVMPDDVGYGDYACLGDPIIHTPAADAFFKQS